MEKESMQISLWDTKEELALHLDEMDPLRHFRDLFFLPQQQDGDYKTYLCSNSLGLQPKMVQVLLHEQLNYWADLGVDGWFQGERAWYNFFERRLREPLAELMGATKEEAIFMNSLTVNLHLLMVSFYQPTPKRYKILMEAPSFSSDLYAIKSHLRYHGFDPETSLIVVGPRKGDHLINVDDIEEALKKHGHEIAIVFLSGVNFLTGQLLPMEKIAQMAHSHGCLIGYDLAHVLGNIPVRLHDWNVDFAVGCSYKYLCSGPGGVGVAFIHQNHFNKDYPRFSGWWGNDPKSRFKLQLQDEFVPHDGAYSWQVSTPSIMALTPFLASLEIYHEAGMEAIRAKSEQQTAFFLDLLSEIRTGAFEITTPRDPSQRGCQISLLINEGALDCLNYLNNAGVIGDFREPNVIRITPSPLYNSYQEVFQCARLLADYFS